MNIPAVQTRKIGAQRMNDYRYDRNIVRYPLPNNSPKSKRRDSKNIKKDHDKLLHSVHLAETLM